MCTMLPHAAAPLRGMKGRKDWSERGTLRIQAWERRRQIGATIDPISCGDMSTATIKRGPSCQFRPTWVEATRPFLREASNHKILPN